MERTVEKLLTAPHFATPLLQVKGGPKTYEHESEHKVEAVLAVRYEKHETYYYVLWCGYDHTYGTWESANNLLDKSAITKFFSVTLQTSAQKMQSSGHVHTRSPWPHPRDRKLKLNSEGAN